MLRSSGFELVENPDFVPVFENTTCPFYRPDEGETPSVPQTGDNTPVTWLIFALIISAAAAAVLCANRRKA